MVKPLYTAVGMQISKTIMENNVEIPQKLEIELPYDPVIPLLAIYPKEQKIVCSRDTCTLIFIAALSKSNPD
jgi:hypothetical protein